MCEQCEMLSINGIACHETGCPLAWKTKTECAWCGQTFAPESRGQRCCEHSCEVAYRGDTCGCDECQPQLCEEEEEDAGLSYSNMDRALGW